MIYALAVICIIVGICLLERVVLNALDRLILNRAGRIAQETMSLYSRKIKK